MRQTTLFNYDLKNKILVITSCSKRKLNHSAPAIDLYQGALFKKVKILAQNLVADFKILSAKYGLINSNKKIKPYEQVIKNQADINRLQETELPKLEYLQQQYIKIIIIMSKKYRKVFEPLLNSENILIIESKKGIGGYLQVLDELNNYSSEKLRQVILSKDEINEREITVSGGKK